MDKHVKILGWLNIIFGIVIGSMVLIAHISFFVQLSDSMSSVMSSELSFSQKYIDFFGRHDVTPFKVLISVASVIAWLAFGIGILRYKEWARLLGLVIAGTALLFTTGELLNFGLGLTQIVQIGICIYSFWVLLSKEVTQRCAAVLK
jgi:hypothetical protein